MRPLWFSPSRAKLPEHYRRSLARTDHSETHDVRHCRPIVRFETRPAGTAGAGARDCRPRPGAQPADRSLPPGRRRYGRAHARAGPATHHATRGPSAASNTASIASHRWSRRLRRVAAPPAGSMACSRPTSGWRRASRRQRRRSSGPTAAPSRREAMPPAGRSVAVDGGYLLSGVWSFCSGCDNAQWLFLGGMIADPSGADGGPLPGAHRGLYHR